MQGGSACKEGDLGLRRCARGKCIQRVANRLVMVASRCLWVVGLRRCARLGGNAFKEWLMALGSSFAAPC